MASRRARFSIPILEGQIQARVERIVDGLEADMKDIVKDGAENMQRFIDTAVTETGVRRVAAGGQHAGRRESDDMYEAVKSEVERESRNVIVGRFGWIDGYEEYYGLQEEGFGNVEGMDAIGQSYAIAEDRLRGVVKRVR